MALIEELDDFFDPDEFADAAVYDGATIYGIFKRDYALVGDVESKQPMLVCAESDVSGIANGETLTIDAVSYEVIEPQPDGTGIITLVLNEA